MDLMTKNIKIEVKNIKKSNDKKFVFETYENILESIINHPNLMSPVDFDKTLDAFTIVFNIKVCKMADMLWVLIQEFLSLIIETEPCLEVRLTQCEEDGTGIIYLMSRK